MNTGIFIRRLVRTAAVVLLVVVGSTILVRCAPGYLSDTREMDARFAGAARESLAAEAARSKSVAAMLHGELLGWLRWNLGTSRQYQVPVWELIKPRLAVTGGLLFRSIILAWVVAGGAAAASHAGRHLGGTLRVLSTVLLAIPVGAMATACLLADSGGPLLVMTVVLATRDYKFVDRALRAARKEPFLLHQRALGVAPARVAWAHLLPAMAPQLGSLATLSILTALGAVVPVEVIFSVPGAGQLAWNAAMNRDLPVLLAITMMMAVAVAGSGAWMESEHETAWKSA